MILDLSKLNNLQRLKYDEIFNKNKPFYLKFIENIYDKSDKNLIFKLSSITSRDLNSNNLLIKFTDISFIEYYLDNFEISEVRVYDKKYFKILKKKLIKQQKKTLKLFSRKNL